MDGFKDSTKTQYSQGGSCYAKGGAVKGAAKVSKVMGEFKSGSLHSGSKKGPKVTNPKQAIAISLSEARKAPMKKAGGGYVNDGTVDESSEENVRGIPQRDNFRKRKGLEVSKTTVRTIPAEPQTELSRRLSGPPEPARRDPTPSRAKRGFDADPLIPSYRDIPVIGGALGEARDLAKKYLGLKKGGLAAMPGKKC